MLNAYILDILCIKEQSFLRKFLNNNLEILIITIVI